VSVKGENCSVCWEIELWGWLGASEQVAHPPQFFMTSEKLLSAV